MEIVNPRKKQKGNPLFIGYRKRMIEMFVECARFNTRLKIADQATMIFKEGWFSDLETQEICRQISHEDYAQEPLT